MYEAPLRRAVIEITNRCNLRCLHCASTSGTERADELTLAEWLHVLREIRSLGGEEITVIGGEALLHPAWRQICEYVRQLEMQLILITNGLLLRQPEQMRQLKELSPHLIGVSLDGANARSYREIRGVDGFDHVVSLLHRLRQDGHPHVNAITTVMRSNLHEFQDFAALFADTGITWQVQLANKGGGRFHSGLFISRDEYIWLTQQMREIFVHRRDQVHLRAMDDFGYFPLDPALRFLHQTWHGCIAGVSLIGIRSNGDVAGCLSLADDFVEGNLRRTPLSELWRTDQYFQCFRHKQQLLTGHCQKCAFSQECRGGCSSIAWSATGSLGCNPYCIRQHEIAEIVG